MYNNQEPIKDKMCRNLINEIRSVTELHKDVVNVTTKAVFTQTTDFDLKL